MTQTGIAGRLAVSRSVISALLARLGPSLTQGASPAAADPAAAEMGTTATAEAGLLGLLVNIFRKARRPS
jgi:hypothetical protein